MRTQEEIKENLEKTEENWREQFNAQRATRQGKIHTDMDPNGREIMYNHYRRMADMYLDQMAILEWVLESDEME